MVWRPGSPCAPNVGGAAVSGGPEMSNVGAPPDTDGTLSPDAGISPTTETSPLVPRSTSSITEGSVAPTAGPAAGPNSSGSSNTSGLPGKRGATSCGPRTSTAALGRTAVPAPTRTPPVAPPRGLYPVAPPAPLPVPMPSPPKNTAELPYFKRRSAVVVPSILLTTSGGHVPEALQVLYKSSAEARFVRRARTMATK